ncbi:MAG: zinc ABC transporter substrate-binding protein [Parachlamydiales bacterium]|nr:zinc ABC transporter substrate-binding protein [Parachlamydiales bacterium]
MAPCCQHSPTSNKVKVLVSVAPYATFIKEIAGDLVDIIILVPSGSSPHTYEPSAKQTSMASNAVIWFRIDEAFENRILTALSSSHPDMKIINLQQSLPLIHACCSDEGFDTHTWLSPKLAQEQAKLITRNLIDLFPEQEKDLNERLNVFIKRLINLDHVLKEITDTAFKKILLVSHPAYGYFCRDYGIKQLSIEWEGKEPSPKRLTRLIKTIQDNQLKCIFTQIQYSQKGSRLLADELGLKIYETNPYSNDYFGEMENVARLWAGCSQ